jgi:hypothetical protein
MLAPWRRCDRDSDSDVVSVKVGRVVWAVWVAVRCSKGDCRARNVSTHTRAAAPAWATAPRTPARYGSTSDSNARRCGVGACECVWRRPLTAVKHGEAASRHDAAAHTQLRRLPRPSRATAARTVHTVLYVLWCVHGGSEPVGRVQQVGLPHTVHSTPRPHRATPSTHAHGARAHGTYICARCDGGGGVRRVVHKGGEGT